MAGEMVKDIAEHFRRSPMRISQSILEFETKLRDDKPLREMVEKLERDLIKKAKKKYFITIA
jgi:CRISPR/Cas system CSM-associated protein Csm4 (group 5 of RAMP superfamily)